MLLALYAHALTGIDTEVIITVIYVVLVGILLTGAGEAMLLTLFVSLLAVAGVAVFASYTGSAITVGSFAGLQLSGLGTSGIWLALPFAVTFFLGLEGVPFAAEEAKNPGRDVPIGLLLSLLLVVVTGSLVLILGPAGVGLESLSGSEQPILAGLSAPRVGALPIVGQLVTIAAVLGLTSCLFSSIYAYSRQVFAMARDEELPKFLSHLNSAGASGGADHTLVDQYGRRADRCTQSGYRGDGLLRMPFLCDDVRLLHRAAPSQAFSAAALQGQAGLARRHGRALPRHCDFRRLRCVGSSVVGHRRRHVCCAAALPRRHLLQGSLKRVSSGVS